MESPSGVGFSYCDKSAGCRHTDTSTAQDNLQSILSFFAAYPELKADRHFLELQRELSLTEDRIAASRRFYNANVRELNTLRIEFPSNLVAGVFGFREERFIELDDPSARAAPQLRM
jgi:LemA protein